MQAPALILFAHGARDPRWSEPFARVLAMVDAAVPQRQPVLAFLELMQPDLAEAVQLQVTRGFRSIAIVPLFLGMGGHLRRDVPLLLEGIRHRHPGVSITLAGPAGEDEAVVASIAAFCIRARAPDD